MLATCAEERTGAGGARFRLVRWCGDRLSNSQAGRRLHIPREIVEFGAGFRLDRLEHSLESDNRAHRGPSETRDLQVGAGQTTPGAGLRGTPICGDGLRIEDSVIGEIRQSTIGRLWNCSGVRATS